MSAPALSSYINGSGQVSADNLNTFIQSCNTIAELRAFIGLPGIQIYVKGFISIADGGQGFFYWNASGGGTDNGTTNIVPSGAASGAWNRIINTLVIPYTYLVPITGFSTTIPNYVNEIVLNPVGTLATGTIIMPATAYDGQPVRISSSQTITTLTVSANSGQSISGAPTTITSITPFGFIYRLANTTWYRA